MTEKTEPKNTTEITVSVTEKKCGKCGIVKPASEFWKMRSSKDGLQSQCKACQLGTTTTEKAPKEKKDQPAKTMYQVVKEREAAEKAKPKEKAPKKEKPSKAQPIGSGRRKECANCTYQIKSTEGGRCISEDAEKDHEKDAKGTCKHLVMTKTAKKRQKASKKEDKKE